MDLTEVDVLIQTLNTSLNAGRVSYPMMPSLEDGYISEIIDYYKSVSEAARSNFHSRFATEKLSNVLRGYSIRMAVFSVRENSTEYILKALLAQVIEDFQYDWRENYIDIGIIRHSILKINADPVNLFEEAAHFATPKTAERLRVFAELWTAEGAAQYLQNFAKPSPSGGVYGVMGEDGFRYVYAAPIFPISNRGKNQPDSNRI